jgi:hypothetical protein
MSAAAGDAEYPVADSPRARVVADCLDLAHELETWNVNRCPGRSRISALSLEEIGAIESGSPNSHKDLIRARRRTFDVADLEHFWTAGPSDDDPAHHGCAHRR